MPKKTSRVGYKKKTEIDPLVRASAALKRLSKATENIDEKDLPKIKKKLSNILQEVIDDIDTRSAPIVECLKLCAQIRDDKLAIQVFNKLQPPKWDKLGTFVRKAKGFTRGEHLYLRGVLRRHTAYFDGSLETKMQALYDEKKYQKGLALVREWLGKIEGDDHLYAREGLYLSRLGRHQEAITSFDRSIAIDAGVFAWWVFRGDAYADLGEYDAAIRDFSISFSLDGDNWAAYDKCARAYYLSGREEEGIRYEEYAVKKGRAPEAMLVLISMLKMTGQLVKARKWGKTGLKEFPKDARFQEALDEIEAS